MSKSKSQSQKRDQIKESSSREAQNERAKDAAKIAGLNPDQSTQLHRELGQIKKTGENLTFPEIVEIAKEIKKK